MTRADCIRAVTVALDQMRSHLDCAELFFANGERRGLTAHDRQAIANADNAARQALEALAKEPEAAELVNP
jgi:hypothetical protein